MGNSNKKIEYIDRNTAEFLQRKGTIEILAELGHEPQRHVDLRRKISMSSSTLQKRLKIGKENNIWKQALQERGSNSVKVYELTDFGTDLYAALRYSADGADRFDDIIQFYEERREINRELEEIERRFISTVSPADADWINEIDLEEHDIAGRQQFLSEKGFDFTIPNKYFPEDDSERQ